MSSVLQYVQRVHISGLIWNSWIACIRTQHLEGSTGMLFAERWGKQNFLTSHSVVPSGGAPHRLAHQYSPCKNLHTHEGIWEWWSNRWGIYGLNRWSSYGKISCWEVCSKKKCWSLGEYPCECWGQQSSLSSITDKSVCLKVARNSFARRSMVSTAMLVQHG